ncbi:hypothetical protein BC834DRAFT_994968 [Gloeopeniophorella convolvens]|nr:hypothetical protein BC834DRAFT_994968 [Gloeopeniophorella convolvens]
MRTCSPIATNWLKKRKRLRSSPSMERQLSFDDIGSALYSIEGPDIHPLFQYRSKCRQAVVECLQNALELTSEAARELFAPSTRILSIPGAHQREIQSFSYSNCKELYMRSPRWWGDLLVKIKSEVESGKRSPSVKSLAIRQLFESSLKKHAYVEGQNSCLMCATTYAERGPRFCAALEDEINDAIRQVSFASEPSNPGFSAACRVSVPSSVLTGVIVSLIACLHRSHSSSPGQKPTMHKASAHPVAGSLATSRSQIGGTDILISVETESLARWSCFITKIRRRHRPVSFDHA